MQQSNRARSVGLIRPWCSHVTRPAYYGLFIALVAIVLATFARMKLCGTPFSLSGFYAEHCRHQSLRALDLLPFIFLIWGQYVGMRRAAADTGSPDVAAGARDSDKDDRAGAQTPRAIKADSLTGLPNRAAFIEQLESAVAAADESRTRFGLVVLDLDGFSEVNEQFGAVNGDLVLKSVAQRLVTAMTDDAALARFSGDKFGVLLTAPQSVDSIESAGRRIRAALEPPCTLDGLVLNLGASIGAALYPDHAQDGHGLLDVVDGAMQHAKVRGGGFQLVRASKPMRDAGMQSLSAELRSAVAGDELRLHLQPIIDFGSHRVRGLEALVRWQHPRRGLIMPGDFIPRAERGGLMRELSHWVLHRALDHAGRLHQAGWPVGISVNLSARSLLDPDLPDILADLLTTYAVPGRFLTLEITENTLMIEQRRTLDVVTRIANMGVQISIDDFGTGYSQLAYLKRLPVSEIKIDRSFVQDMLVSRTDHSIVQATIGLAHALDMRVVAEGIEDPTQAEQLQALSCDLMQGFHIGRPMAMDKLCAWLTEWSSAGPA